jgi:hypothetical protein
MAKGRAEGEKAKALAVAKNALQMGMGADDIAHLTGLGREEITRLADTL